MMMHLTAAQQRLCDEYFRLGLGRAALSYDLYDVGTLMFYAARILSLV